MVRTRVGIVLGLVFVIFLISVNRIVRRDMAMRRTVRRAAAFVEELEQIRTRTGTYPVSDETPVDNVLSTHPFRDGWGRSFRYISSGESYVLWSFGKDGKPDRLPGGGEFEDRRMDLIVYSGEVWQGPAGVF